MGNEVTPTSLVGWSLLGRPAAEAFGRLVGGGLRGYPDVELAEVALRAIVLHEHAAKLDARVSILGDEDGSVFERVPALQPTWATDDPRLPASLRDHFENSMAGLRAYNHGKIAEKVPGTKARAYMVAGTGEEIVLDDGTRVRDPAFQRVFQAFGTEFQMVTDLAVGFEGGASILAAGTRLDVVRDDLERHYDKAEGPSILMPRLLPIVLARSLQRERIPEAVVTLRAELADAVGCPRAWCAAVTRARSGAAG